MSGPDIPDAVGSFEQLSISYSLPRYITKNVAAMGYQEPTPIQMQAIPLLLHVSLITVTFVWTVIKFLGDGLVSTPGRF